MNLKQPIFSVKLKILWFFVDFTHIVTLLFHLPVLTFRYCCFQTDFQNSHHFCTLSSSVCFPTVATPLDPTFEKESNAHVFYPKIKRKRKLTVDNLIWVRSALKKYVWGFWSTWNAQIRFEKKISCELNMKQNLKLFKGCKIEFQDSSKPCTDVSSVLKRDLAL